MVQQQKRTDMSPEEKEMKYRIHYLLRQLSYEEYTIAMKFFPATFKVSSATWKRWIYMKQSQHSHMPAGAAYTLSVFFEVEPHEIFTTPPPVFRLEDLYKFSRN